MGPNEAKHGVDRCKCHGTTRVTPKAEFVARALEREMRCGFVGLDFHRAVDIISREMAR